MQSPSPRAHVDLSGSGQAGIGSDITSDAAGNVYFFWPAFGDELGGDPLSVDVYSTGFMAGLFADNFESGETSAWSTVVGDVTAWSTSVP